MKTRSPDTVDEVPAADWPDAASLAALRAWYEGVGSCRAGQRYPADRHKDGASSRSTIGRIGRQVIAYSVVRHWQGLAEVLARATLGDIDTDAYGDHWLKVVGMGAKPGQLTLPLLARIALDRYLVHRGLPVTPSKWKSATSIVRALDGETGITSDRLWRLMKRFFGTLACVVEEGSPAMAEKLRRATPHWMRHTHASHALEHGADLTTVRDNLRHASAATTSLYLHVGGERRAKQISAVFSEGRR